MRWRRIAVPVAVVASSAVMFTAPASAVAPLVVTTTAVSGAGSLRQAILDANVNPGADSIRFAIPGSGIHVITVTNGLPMITGSVSIDGRTQPGYTGTPIIEVAQAAATGTYDTFSFAS